MENITNKWLRATFKQGAPRRVDLIPLPGQGLYYTEVRPRAICKDGFSVSIQADALMCCSPRADGNIVYERVELGWPSTEDDLINEYAEKFGPETVYEYVPVEIVDRLLSKHGGIVNWPTTD